MPTALTDVFSFLGFLLRVLGFFVAGLAIGRFVLDNYKDSAWQVQIALALGLFGLLIGLTDFASPGSAGAFALGAGAAYFMSMTLKKSSEK